MQSLYGVALDCSCSSGLSNDGADDVRPLEGIGHFDESPSSEAFGIVDGRNPQRASSVYLDLLRPIPSIKATRWSTPLPSPTMDPLPPPTTAPGRSRSRPTTIEVSGNETSEIDPLLDKIAKHGLGSLTSQERAALERARAKLLEKDRG